MPFDAHANFAYSTVAVAPSPAASGTSLSVALGDGTLFPTPPFNVTVCPADEFPLTTNAEILRVTAIVGDAFTITREQEDTSARTIVVGDQIFNSITDKVITDLETAAAPGGADTSVQFNNGGSFGGFGTWDGSTFTIPSPDILKVSFIEAGDSNNLHPVGNFILEPLDATGVDNGTLIQVTSGAATGTGAGGDLLLLSGNQAGTGFAAAGTLYVVGGEAFSDGSGGEVQVQGGNAHGDGDGGDVIIWPGAANGAGTAGRVQVRSSAFGLLMAFGDATSPIVANQSITLAENAGVALNPAGSSDGVYTGITVTGTAGTTLAFGDVIYLAVADSRWELVDADSVTTCGAVFTGMCVLAAAADGSPTRILLNGIIRADAAFPNLTVGAPVYASTTPGDVQVAAPSGTDDIVHVLGYGMTANEMYFNPSTTYLVVA